MEESGDRDAFVISGTRFEIEKGNRYRILWKDGSIYEGTYMGFFECNPICRTVALVDVVQIRENNSISDDEHMFCAFDKAGIRNIEKIEHDISLAAIKKIVEPENPGGSHEAGRN
jgi:hypothetical protein